MEGISHSSENGISDLGAENNTFPALRACKAIKAGEKASQEIIHSWKENGFSRYLNFKVKYLTPIQKTIKLIFYYLQPNYCCTRLGYLDTG
jgi:hypothetical protein